ncbi:XRE family transcriptional regulator [Fodinicurvata fenggangensis]|uniref:XRE family transcriptional regulator n=1 Tax=Fodinicurvata fenggangensis TaxID=1121830 RepID=UPI00047A6B76|nr:XRE family transcriptional regulator [Fodinicurvata fenggangensis]
MTHPIRGSSLDDSLKEADLRDTAQPHVLKSLLAWQLDQEMKRQGLTKSEMARRMNTSRAQLDRLLDPGNDRVQLDKLQRAATILGRSLRLELA